MATVKCARKCLSMILLVAALSLKVSHAALEFNVLEAVNLTPGRVDKFTDVQLTNGKDDGSAAFILGKGASSLSNEDKYSDFKDSFDRSDDITLVLTFKISKTTVEQKQAVAFALLSTNLGRQYLSFKIRVANVSDVGLEGEEGKNKLVMSIDITYRVFGSNQLATIKIGEDVQFGDWQNLMVRIKNHKTIETYIRCGEKPKIQELLFAIPKLPSKAQMRAAQNAQRGVFSGNEEIFERLVGTVQRLEFLFGADAYDFLNPCMPRLNKLRPEGLKSTPAEVKYVDRFLTLSGQNLPKGCVENGINYANGEQFKKSKCEDCTCNNGLTECKTDTCITKPCTSGSFTPAGECCSLCQETYCARFGKVYNSCGCTSLCGQESPAANCSCTPGCHCPKNTYQDANGNCVEQHFCTCASDDGKTIYKPNQLSTVNPCLICICTLGEFLCLPVCFS